MRNRSKPARRMGQPKREPALERVSCGLLTERSWKGEAPLGISGVNGGHRYARALRTYAIATLIGCRFSSVSKIRMAVESRTREPLSAW